MLCQVDCISILFLDSHDYKYITSTCYVWSKQACTVQHACLTSAYGSRALLYIKSNIEVNNMCTEAYCTYTLHTIKIVWKAKHRVVCNVKQSNSTVQHCFYITLHVYFSEWYYHLTEQLLCIFDPILRKKCLNGHPYKK